MTDLTMLAKKRRRMRFDDDEDEEFIIHLDNIVERERKFLRKRWDSDYLLALAGQEGSFTAEYRLDPGGFDILTDLLEAGLSRKHTQALNSLSRSGSEPISVASRLGSALILLAGGRYMEAMRTHGLPQSTVYSNLHEVVAVINSIPQLAIECPNDKPSLIKRATEFAAKSEKGLFKHCTGAIDGLAIRIEARSSREVQNQTRFYNGNKKAHCINMQGVCDAHRRFIAVCCKHTGNTNDVDAFMNSDLRRLCASQEYP